MRCRLRGNCSGCELMKKAVTWYFLILFCHNENHEYTLCKCSISWNDSLLMLSSLIPPFLWLLPFSFLLMLLYFAWKLMKYQQSFQAAMQCCGVLCTNLCVVLLFLFLYGAWAEKPHKQVKNYSHHHKTSLTNLEL